jgi:hypothetical protein
LDRKLVSFTTGEHPSDLLGMLLIIDAGMK